jgi:hypothetical protein
MWFGKAVEDFNNAVELQGDRAPQLIAEISNGFISTFLAHAYVEATDVLPVVWVGYAFHAIPVVCALVKIHVTRVPAGKV